MYFVILYLFISIAHREIQVRWRLWVLQVVVVQLGVSHRDLEEEERRIIQSTDEGPHRIPHFILFLPNS